MGSATRLPPDVLPIRPEDHLSIVLWRCSSVHHSWKERHTKNIVERLVSQDQDQDQDHDQGDGTTTILLSAWADRVTRRSTDLEDIEAWLERMRMTWWVRRRKLITEDVEAETFNEGTTGEWCATQIP